MTQMDLFQTATSSQQDTPASPFHLPGSAEAVKMTDISGHTFSPLFKEKDPLGAFSKMFMGMSLWASTKCYLTWKGKATPQGRSLFQLVPQTHLTDETEFGSSPEIWPTPTAHNSQEKAYPAEFRRNTITLTAQAALSEAERKMWPTPTARDHKDCGENMNLYRSERQNTQLGVVAKRSEIARQMFPTPAASDNRDRGHIGMPAIQRRMEKGKQLNLSMVVSEVSGSLNPQWVEWLMGYPEGWTDLKD
jgi:hypothetical protein